MKLHYDGKLGIITFRFDLWNTQLVFTFDHILPWEIQRMEMVGVTCRMDASSTAMKDNSKMFNDRAIDMLLF